MRNMQNSNYSKDFDRLENERYLYRKCIESELRRERRKEFRETIEIIGVFVALIIFGVSFIPVFMFFAKLAGIV